jgi:YebC/PmpR family DNA-binding regulatory protein
MAGHSKWAQIKRQKAVTDKKKGRIFTRLGHAIMIAVREGGGKDPAMNPRLRVAAEAAKAAGMPKENIERAIKRGAGELGGQLTEAVYEGYGPGGVAIIVETMTDNTNRTLNEVRLIFSRHGGNLGSTGAVAWMFARQGVLRVPLQRIADRDQLELQAIEVGAVDIIEDDEELMVVSPLEMLASTRTGLIDLGIEVASAGLEFLTTNPTEADDETAEKVLRLVEALEDLDDVQAVTTTIA